MKKDIMHISIPDSVGSRKNVLEGVISSIQCLKDFERVKIIRKQKMVYRKELLKKIGEINKLFSSIKVPKVKMEGEHKKPKKVHQKKKTLNKVPRKVKSKNKEISKLEDDISALKEKISSL